MELGASVREARAAARALITALVFSSRGLTYVGRICVLVAWPSLWQPSRQVRAVYIQLSALIFSSDGVARRRNFEETPEMLEVFGDYEPPPPAEKLVASPSNFLGRPKFSFSLWMPK